MAWAEEMTGVAAEENDFAETAEGEENAGGGYNGVGDDAVVDEGEDIPQIPDGGTGAEKPEDEDAPNTDDSGGESPKNEADEDEGLENESGGGESKEPEDNGNEGQDEGATEPPDAEDGEGSDEADAGKADEDGKSAADGANTSVLSVEKQKTIDELGFKTMAINQAMVQEKKVLSQVVSSMEAMEAGEGYVEKEIIYLADSEKEAKEIAECYGGTLENYDYKIAVASIEQDVLDAVKVAADTDIPIPAVYPNVIYRINDEWDAASIDGSEVTVEEISKTDEAVEEDSEDVEDKRDGLEEEPLYTIEGEETVYAINPTDPQYNNQWHHSVVNTVEAWDATKGSGVTVAVLDSGVDANHPDLPADIECIETVGYGSGRDDNGHGTHCAGIIAAQANGMYGVGIAPEASIYSVKILGADGSGTTETAIKGMRSAVSRNVDVISMSFGSFCYDALFQKEIDAATAKGIVLVAAAGNEGTSQKSYPAAYNNVIAVAAVSDTTSKDSANNLYYHLTSFSNYGTWVDIAAPGYQIGSTLPTYTNTDPDAVNGTYYGSASGTSMACPIVAATVAMMLANNSALKNTNTKAGVSKITKTLIDSASPYGALDPYIGTMYPLVDVEAATYAVDSSVPQPPTVRFKSGEPDSKNVVLAGADEYITFEKTTPHAKIYFTVNGKKPTAKTGRRYYDGTKIVLNASGKVKIQAVTVVGNKTSKVFSKTYKLDVKATGLTSPYHNFRDDITVAIGKSIQLDVNVLPSITSNKKLTWSSNDATGMIKVNKSGKVTCNKKTAAETQAVITAKTTDGTNLEYSFTVTAKNEKVEFLTLNKTAVKMSWHANAMKNDGNEMKEPDGTSYEEFFQLVPSNSGVETNQYLYKSSNTKVAVVSSDGLIMALGKGKAKITVTANDGSGMKAVCDVTVVTPVYEIRAVSSTGYGDWEDIPIGTGCTITMKTIVNDNSKYYIDVPNNKSLEWTSTNPGVISVKNGKITCSKNATIDDKVNVTVRAKDGWGTSRTITFKVVDKIEKIYYVSGGKKYSSAKLYGDVGEAGYDPLTNGNIAVDTMHGTGLIENLFEVNISNRDVIYRYYNSKVGAKIILGTKPGTSKLTYTATDGSKKKITLTYKINARDLKL